MFLMLVLLFGLGMYVLGRLHERIAWTEWSLWEINHSSVGADLSWTDRTPTMQNDLQGNFFKSILLRDGKEYRDNGK